MYPLVSIIIPVYNGEKYMREAIDSALNQTYKNIEVIVVNDGSKDKTDEIALSYGDKIRYFKKENGGVSTALNLGINEMKGEYFCWLSHDDVYEENKVESHINLLDEENKDCVFMCGSYFIDENSQALSRKVKKFAQGFLTYRKVLSEIFKGKTINGCALFIPKKHFDRVGLFNEQIRYMQDSEMWYRLLTQRVNFVVHSSDVCVKSRVHSQQATVTLKRIGKKDADQVGPNMVQWLLGLPEEDRYLLREYMFLCCRNRSNLTGKMIYGILCEQKKLNFVQKIKYYSIFVYGKIRPFLVKCYYKLFFGIRVKK